MDPTLIVAIGGLLVLLFLIHRAATRAITIADLEIQRGVVKVVRGGIAPPILADLRDIAKTPPIASLRVSIVRASGLAEVRFDGTVNDAQAQRIRNVVGSVPLARLVNAGRR